LSLRRCGSRACRARRRPAALLNTLADLHHAAGNEDEAMALFAEIAEETGRDYPEIWKMTEW
jgi:hypothetical protein